MSFIVKYFAKVDYIFFTYYFFHIINDTNQKHTVEEFQRLLPIQTVWRKTLKIFRYIQLRLSRLSWSDGGMSLHNRHLLFYLIINILWTLLVYENMLVPLLYTRWPDPHLIMSLYTNPGRRQRVGWASRQGPDSDSTVKKILC